MWPDCLVPEVHLKFKYEGRTPTEEERPPTAEEAEADAALDILNEEGDDDSREDGEEEDDSGAGENDGDGDEDAGIVRERDGRGESDDEDEEEVEGGKEDDVVEEGAGGLSLPQSQQRRVSHVSVESEPTVPEVDPTPMDTTHIQDVDAPAAQVECEEPIRTGRSESVERPGIAVVTTLSEVSPGVIRQVTAAQVRTVQSEPSAEREPVVEPPPSPEPAASVPVSNAPGVQTAQSGSTVPVVAPPDNNVVVPPAVTLASGSGSTAATDFRTLRARVEDMLAELNVFKRTFSPDEVGMMQKTKEDLAEVYSSPAARTDVDSVNRISESLRIWRTDSGHSRESKVKMTGMLEKHVQDLEAGLPPATEADILAIRLERVERMLRESEAKSKPVVVDLDDMDDEALEARLKAQTARRSNVGGEFPEVKAEVEGGASAGGTGTEPKPDLKISPEYFHKMSKTITIMLKREDEQKEKEAEREKAAAEKERAKALLEAEKKERRKAKKLEQQQLLEKYEKQILTTNTIIEKMNKSLEKMQSKSGGGIVMPAPPPNPQSELHNVSGVSTTASGVAEASAVSALHRLATPLPSPLSVSGLTDPSSDDLALSQFQVVQFDRSLPSLGLDNDDPYFFEVHLGELDGNITDWNERNAPLLQASPAPTPSVAPAEIVTPEGAAEDVQAPAVGNPST